MKNSGDSLIRKTQNAEGLVEFILEKSRVFLNSDSGKHIAQTYDSAAVMSSEKVGIKALNRQS